MFQQTKKTTKGRIIARVIPLLYAPLSTNLGGVLLNDSKQPGVLSDISKHLHVGFVNE